MLTRLLLLTALLLPVTAPGQTAGDTVTLELLTLSFGRTSPGYYYRNGEDVLKLDASRQSISAPLLYKGPRLLALYKEAAHLAPLKEGQERPKPVAVVKLPEKDDRALLLFVFEPGKKNKDKDPRVTSIGVPTTGMKGGDYRVFNLSSQAIGATLDDEKLGLRQGQNKVASATDWGREIKDVRAQFFIEKEGKMKNVYATFWGHRPERRMFVFVMDRPGNERNPLNVKVFYDLPGIRAERPQPAANEESTPEPEPSNS